MAYGQDSEKVKMYKEMKRIGQKGIDKSGIKEKDWFFAVAGILFIIMGAMVSICSALPYSGGNLFFPHLPASLRNLSYIGSFEQNITLTQHLLATNNTTLAQGIIYGVAEVTHGINLFLGMVVILIGIIIIMAFLKGYISKENYYEAERIIKQSILDAGYSEKEYKEFREFQDLMRFVGKFD